MKHKTPLLLGLVAVVLFLLSWKIAYSEFKPSDKSLYEQLPVFSEVLTYVQDRYVEEISAKNMVYGAMRGVANALDAHSEFMSPTQFEELQVETQGEFGGIGIVISIRDSMLTVVSPLTGSPAEKAGIKPQDRIVEIEGKTTKDITLSEAVKLLRGQPGSKVKLTVLREGEQKLLLVEVERDLIRLESVKSAELIDKDVGYLRIIEFTDKTEKDLKKKMLKLRKEGATAWIWDVRNNPGGLLESSIDVGKLVLQPNALIVYTKGRMAQDEMSFYASANEPLFKEPLVILVNEGSASASEIIAGAVKDNKRGVTVGQKTFGKGSVQTVFPLQDGSALRLTTALYYTANGNVIHMKGILPDVVVSALPEEVETEDEESEKKNKEDEKNGRKTMPKPKKLDPEKDVQLKTAIEMIRQLQQTGQWTLIPEDSPEEVPTAS